MKTLVKINGHEFQVAAEHGRRGNADHVLTLVRNPESLHPEVVTLRAAVMDLGAFTPIAEEKAQDQIEAA